MNGQVKKGIIPVGQKLNIKFENICYQQDGFPVKNVTKVEQLKRTTFPGRINTSGTTQMPPGPSIWSKTIFFFGIMLNNKFIAKHMNLSIIWANYAKA